MGNSWRTTADIDASWMSVLANLDNSVGLARFAGPGGWNDLDMLEARHMGEVVVPEPTASRKLSALHRFLPSQPNA